MYRSRLQPKEAIMSTPSPKATTRDWLGQLSGATGIAILGTIGAAVYHAAMSGVVPAGLPEAAKAAAESTLGGAMAVAAQLGGDAAVALIADAQAAFMTAMSTTGSSAGLILVGSAVLVLLLSWRSRLAALAPAE
jgi:DHA2 family multidrug resistance protein-like MFS transporter